LQNYYKQPTLPVILFQGPFQNNNLKGALQVRS
jgi:hypothetical protein